jgi:hypothetical protein
MSPCAVAMIGIVGSASIVLSVVCFLSVLSVGSGYWAFCLIGSSLLPAVLSVGSQLPDRSVHNVFHPSAMLLCLHHWLYSVH